MKKLLFIPAILAMITVGCNKAGGKTPDPGPSGTDWSEDIQEEMEYYLGEILPFVQLDSTTMYHEWDEDINGYFVGDESSENLVADYADELTDWEETEDSYGDVCYVKQNIYGETLQLYVDWYEATEEYPEGNEIAVYVFAGISGDTIDFTNLGLENGEKYTEPFETENCEVTFAGGGSNGQYVENDNGASIRLYQNGTLTITANDYIKSITFEFFKHSSSNSKIPTTTTAQFNTGTYDASEMVWSGSSKTVVLTCKLTSGHFALAGLSISFDE